MTHFKIGFALALLLLILTVIIQNTKIVLLHFLAWKMEISLVLVLTLTFLVGLAVGVLITTVLSVRRSRQRR